MGNIEQESTLDIIDSNGEIVLSESDSAINDDSYLIRVGPFRFGKAGLEVEGKPDFNTCNNAVTTLKAAHNIIQLAIGDLLNYMQGRFGEAYSQALEASDYSGGTAANVQWVARKVAPEVRRLETLTFDHHRAVAPLPVEQQIEWLDRAEREGLSARTLRKMIHKPQLPLPSDGRAKGIVYYEEGRLEIWCCNDKALKQIDTIIEATRTWIDWE